jgi:hypothetical protein
VLVSCHRIFSMGALLGVCSIACGSFAQSGEFLAQCFNQAASC